MQTASCIKYKNNFYNSHITSGTKIAIESFVWLTPYNTNIKDLIRT